MQILHSLPPAGVLGGTGTVDDECLEFSGVNLENGFQRMDPPVRINVEEMPLRTDGKMTSTLFCVVLDVIPAMFLDM